MDIPTNVTYLAALSMASERLVEIIRGYLKIGLTKPNPGVTPQGGALEAVRIANINALSVGTGIVTAVLAKFVNVLPG